MPLTHPITANPDFEALSLRAQNFYYRMRDELDDLGFISVDAQYLKSRLSPLRPDLRLPDITAFIAELCKSGMVRETNNHYSRPVLHSPDCEQRKKRTMTSEHVPPEELNQMFLPTGTKEEVQKKEGRKEGKARARMIFKPLIWLLSCPRIFHEDRMTRWPEVRSGASGIIHH